jgi:L-ascorbate metabolism protein UlaG (beta-lactamase superfamily)
VADVDVYDPVKNSWHEAEDLPRPVAFSGVVAMGSQIFVVGGTDAEFDPYRSNQVGSVAADPIKVTYIANAGFLVESSTRKVLIDGLFQEGYGQYLTPTPEVRAQIINRQPPFHDIDLLLVTHGHGDHFDASLVGQQLQQSPNGFLVAPKDAVDFMRELPYFRGIEEQIHEVTPPQYGSERVTLNGIEMEIVRLQHDNRPQIQNLGFILTMDGVTILHVGDNTAANREEFEGYLLNNRGIDIAFLNHYGHWSTEEERALSKEFIDPGSVILTHIPPTDVDSIASQVEKIGPGFPPIWVFSQPMEVRYPLGGAVR